LVLVAKSLHPFSTFRNLASYQKRKNFMALTPSKMLSLNTIAPNFDLLDTVSNSNKNLQALRGEKATVIMFICNHCPYVIHLNQGIADLAKAYTKKGVAFVGISANDVENYPQDGPEHMKANAAKNDFIFPYVYDETQAIAKQYDAACTPDFYVFDKDLKLAYRGQFDDSRPGNGKPVTGKDIKAAIDALLNDDPVSEKQVPSIGCNIKWKF